jgi:hypothetical protein
VQNKLFLNVWLLDSNVGLKKSKLWLSNSNIWQKNPKLWLKNSNSSGDFDCEAFGLIPRSLLRKTGGAGDLFHCQQLKRFSFFPFFNSLIYDYDEILLCGCSLCEPLPGSGVLALPAVPYGVLTHSSDNAGLFGLLR